jgi:hypothetical protein
MAQTKKGSFLEACTNTAIGFIINFTINFFVLGSCGFHLTIGKNLLITGTFTVISVLRGYAIRRFVEYKNSEKIDVSEFTTARNELLAMEYLKGNSC